MSTPTDLQLYNKIKGELWRLHPKPSAYRSGLLVKAYVKAMESKGKRPYKGVSYLL